MGFPPAFATAMECETRRTGGLAAHRRRGKRIAGKAPVLQGQSLTAPLTRLAILEATHALQIVHFRPKPYPKSHFLPECDNSRFSTGSGAILAPPIFMAGAVMLLILPVRSEKNPGTNVRVITARYQAGADGCHIRKAASCNCQRVICWR